jgi:hypothetical protein
LIFLPGGFHTADKLAPSGDPEIVCDRCDAVMPDWGSHWGKYIKAKRPPPSLAVKQGRFFGMTIQAAVAAFQKENVQASMKKKVKNHWV